MSLEEDLHNGLSQNVLLQENPILFSVGHRCSSASLIKELHIRFETHPFDWVVSKLNTIVHCIETDFSEFLNPANYEKMNTETFNLCDGVKTHICYENPVINTFYEKDAGENKNGTYGFNLAMTHHDIRTEKDAAYFERCVSRFKNILQSDNKKFYLYIHPIMGVSQYNDENVGLQTQFTAFSEYMNEKTKNARGLYFFIVKNEERKGEIDLLFQNDSCVIHLLYANNALVDEGATFGNDYYTEQYVLLNTIEKLIYSI
jgi:hypothetical protein